jgi:hypothetical protein
MLERLAKVKHSSLLQKSVNYGRKKFFSTGPWAEFSTLGVAICILRIFGVIE